MPASLHVSPAHVVHLSPVVWQVYDYVKDAMLARVEKLGEAEGLISEPPKLSRWQHVLAGRLPYLPQ
jgi:hypothetical protein